MRISDWSSDVCSSDLRYRVHRWCLLWCRAACCDAGGGDVGRLAGARGGLRAGATQCGQDEGGCGDASRCDQQHAICADELSGDCIAPRSFVRMVFILRRSEEHTSELQSLMRSSDAVFCLKKKKLTSEPSICKST